MTGSSLVKQSSLSFILFVLSFLITEPIKAQDNMKGTWMPVSVTKKEDKNTAEIDLFLRPLQGSIRTIVCNYDDVVLKSYTAFTGGKAQNKSSLWDCEILKEKVSQHSDAMDLNVRFRLKEGELTSGGVAVAFDFSNWRTDNYVLAPAAIYNGNRHKVMDLGYCAYIKDKKDKPLDMPVTITNIMHLNLDKSPAKIEMLTGNCSTPMMSFYNSKDKTGCIMLTAQGTQFGNNALIIEEKASEGKATFVISAPGVREKRYVMCGFDTSGDKPADFKEGSIVTLKIRLYIFRATTLQDFYDKIFTERKALSGPTTYRNLAPFSAIAEMILDHHDKHKSYEDSSYGYIANHPEGDNPFGHLSLGGSVPVWSYPQVIQPTDERLRRVSGTLDAFTMMQGKSGFFYSLFIKGRIAEVNTVMPIAISNIRNNSEALYFGIQTLELLRLEGNEKYIKPEWNEMFKRTADAAVRLWDKYGQFANLIDVETGEIDTPGSTAGAEFISGLALASRYFNNPEYLRVAEEAGQYYYEKDLSKGYTGGGPGDILLCQDSESADFLSDAYTILYEMTKKPIWLKYAKEGASLFSTWVVSFNYKFPENSDMNKFGIRTTGSVWASTQNAHSAPGIYVMSGNFLLKLYRATGDKRYMELLRDIVHNVVQYINTKTNHIMPKTFFGSVTERVNLSDWEGKDEIGNFPDGDSNMAWETVSLFSVLMNPGIYLNHETGDMFVFDNVEATIINRDKNRTTIKISNPTPYDAKVSIMSEDNKEQNNSMDMYAFKKWQVLEIPAGKTEQFILNN